MAVFLHVGSGRKRKSQTTAGFNTPDWTEVRLDIDPQVKPDIVGTMTDMSGVPDAAMDGLFSSHNIEHLYPHEVATALGEFRRVLKPTGFAVITCPDVQSVAALIAEGRSLTEPIYTSTAGPISPLDMLYGHLADLAKGNLYMAHRTGFTDHSLEAALREAGFASVVLLRRQRALDLWALATRSPMGKPELRRLVEAHFPTPKLD
jgi:hypothetical protein